MADAGHGGAMSTAGVVKLVAFAISTGMLFGVDLGSIGGGLAGMKKELELTTLQVEGIVSGCKGGAVFGCLVGGAWMAVFGRKRAIIFAVVPFLLGPALIGCAVQGWQALLGRLVVGFGVGAASVAAPCYLSEAAAPSVRGAIVACYELAIAIGFLLSSILAYVLEGSEEYFGDTWRLQTGAVPFLAGVPLITMLCLVPESPRWLLTRHRRCNLKDLREALAAIKMLGVAGTSERLAAVKQKSTGFEALGADNAATSDLIKLWDSKYVEGTTADSDSEDEGAVVDDKGSASEERPSVLRVLRETFLNVAQVACGAAAVPPGARRGLALAVSAAVLNQACASTSVLVYAQQLLRRAGVGSALAQDSMTIAVAASKLGGVLLGLAVVNRVGRRVLLGVGGACSTLALLLVAFSAAERHTSLLLIGLSAFILIFVASWGNGYWVVVTEVTAAGGPKYGASCQAAATASLFATGWLTSFTFVSVVKVGPWSLLVYAGLASLMVFYAVCWLPETRGLTFEECAMLLARQEAYADTDTTPSSASGDSMPSDEGNAELEWDASLE